MARKHHDMRVWQLCSELVSDIYRVTTAFEFDKLDAAFSLLGAQIKALRARVGD